MTESRFPTFDGDRKPYIQVIDGVPTFVTNRHDVEELAVLEPVDTRNDFFASVPLRSAWNDACGPCFEIGAFDLDDGQVVALFNALLRHIERFPSTFRKGGAA